MKNLPLLKSPLLNAVTLLIQLNLGSGHGVVEPRRFHLVFGTSVYIGRIFGSNLRQFPQPFHSNPHTSSYFLLLIIKLALRNLHYLGHVLIKSPNRLL